MQRAPAEATVEAIHRSQQGLPSCLLFAGQRCQQVVLQQAFRLQTLQEHAGLAQGFVGAEQLVCEGQGSLQQHGRVLAGQGQHHGGGIAVKSRAIKGAAAHEDGDRTG